MPNVTQYLSPSLSLDVDAPDQVAGVLRAAAEAYYASAAELSAGHPWTQLARILERAAGQCDARLKSVRPERP